MREHIFRGKRDSALRVPELPQAPEWDGHTSEQAIERIGRLTQPENKPLTLDELRGIDGESVRSEESPLWYGGNGVVSLAKGGVIDPDDPDGCWPFENYGEWLAYRSKPKEEHHEAD